MKNLSILEMQVIAEAMKQIKTVQDIPGVLRDAEGTILGLTSHGMPTLKKLVEKKRLALLKKSNKIRITVKMINTHTHGGYGSTTDFEWEENGEPKRLHWWRNDSFIQAEDSNLSEGEFDELTLRVKKILGKFCEGEADLSPGEIKDLGLMAKEMRSWQEAIS